MKMNEFLTRIKEVYASYFPESLCSVQYSDNIYRSITIRCFLAQNSKECANGYLDNDMMNISFSIDCEGRQFSKDITQDAEIPNNLNLESYHNRYFIKPNDRYLVFEARKVNFRKTKGDSKKIIITLDKFFKSLKDSLINDLSQDKIHDNHIELLKIKLKN